MTNTSFIGDVNRFSNNDKITPFISYKVVSMLNPNEHGEVKLQGPHHGKHHYGFSDEAQHGKNGACLNFETCSCGFYGYNLVEDALDHWKKQCSGHLDATPVLVQVAFSGKVTVCEKGYRASHQRVRKILFGGCCLCKNPSSMVAPHESGYMVPLCGDCFVEAPVQSASGVFRSKKAQSPAPRPVVPAHTFEEYAALHSPVGFAPMTLASVESFGDKEKVLEFFGETPLFAFHPGNNSSIPANFSEYLSTLNQTDMDRLLALASAEMGQRLNNEKDDGAPLTA